MDNSIVVALITAFTAIIVCALSYVLEKRAASELRTQKELCYTLLKILYQPIYTTLVISDGTLEVIEQLNEIFMCSAAYVPPKIEFLLFKLKMEQVSLNTFDAGGSAQETAEEKNKNTISPNHRDYVTLTSCIKSDYNEIRKSLGLAYNQANIDPDNVSYHPTANTIRFWSPIAFASFLYSIIFYYVMVTYLNVSSPIGIVLATFPTVLVIVTVIFSKSITRKRFKNK